MRNLLLILTLFTTLTIKSQITDDDVYPLAKLSVTEDTLFVFNNNVGQCIGELWITNPIKSKTHILVYSDDVDYFLDRRKNCTKIVKTIKLNQTKWN